MRSGCPRGQRVFPGNLKQHIPMKKLPVCTEPASAPDSSRRFQRPPGRRRLPPWLVLSSIMLLTGAIVWTTHAFSLTCHDCCRPDCSGGRGCGVWMGGIDSNGVQWSCCVAADYPACFFGGACQVCPPDECPPGSNGESSGATGTVLCRKPSPVWGRDDCAMPVLRRGRWRLRRRGRFGDVRSAGLVGQRAGAHALVQGHADALPAQPGTGGGVQSVLPGHLGG